MWIRIQVPAKILDEFDLVEIRTIQDGDKHYLDPVTLNFVVEVRNLRPKCPVAVLQQKIRKEANGKLNASGNELEEAENACLKAKNVCFKAKEELRTAGAKSQMLSEAWLAYQLENTIKQSIYNQWTIAIQAVNKAGFNYNKAMVEYHKALQILQIMQTELKLPTLNCSARGLP